MTVRAAGVCALAAVLALGACGTTFVDETVATPDTSPTATTTTLVPVEPDAPLDDVLGEIETLMFDLDQKIVDNDGQTETLDRIDELWSVAEPRIRAGDPNDVYNFDQAIQLARTGVERRRPADASKGYKIMRTVIDAYEA
ncbi:MAG: hypothetical protein ABIP17_03635 [Ilumatobacteraceae bacterium]